MDKLYKRLFTREEFKLNFGYDLLLRVNQGNFTTKEAAVDAWLDEAALSIHLLILRNRGFQFATNIYENENETIRECLKQAQMLEMLFLFENSKLNASAKRDPSCVMHSEDAIDLLYGSGILIVQI